MCMSNIFAPSCHLDLIVSRGTGASAIYPLLGCRLEPSWKFLVTGTLAPVQMPKIINKNQRDRFYFLLLRLLKYS